MKKIIYTLAFAFVGLSAINAQEITFNNEIIDYGNVAKGSDGHRAFTFTNTGDKPLLLKSVKPSCGCTVAEFPKEPIAPGQKGEIKVSYDTNIVSAFNRTITVYSNSTDGERKVLRVKGVVKD
ncbi:DUF1573 domain-containing protein [Flavobacteriaceae bacterium Ap0902]|nr:DUF1573 domain-containing protein [Flavobacteriaceae bacterium Ap0902]